MNKEKGATPCPPPGIMVLFLNCYMKKEAVMDVINFASTNSDEWIVGMNEANLDGLERAIVARNIYMFGNTNKRRTLILTNIKGWNWIPTNPANEIVSIKGQGACHELVITCWYMSPGCDKNITRNVTDEYHELVRRFRNATEEEMIKKRCQKSEEKEGARWTKDKTPNGAGTSNRPPPPPKILAGSSDSGIGEPNRSGASEGNGPTKPSSGCTDPNRSPKTNPDALGSRKNKPFLCFFSCTLLAPLPEGTVGGRD